MKNKKIQSQVLKEVWKPYLKEMNEAIDSGVTEEKVFHNIERKWFKKAISRTIELMEESHVSNKFFIEKLKEQNDVSRMEQKADFRKMIEEVITKEEKEFMKIRNNYSAQEISAYLDFTLKKRLLAKLGTNHSQQDNTPITKPLGETKNGKIGKGLTAGHLIDNTIDSVGTCICGHEEDSHEAVYKNNNNKKCSIYDCKCKKFQEAKDK